MRDAIHYFQSSSLLKLAADGNGAYSQMLSTCSTTSTFRSSRKSTVRTPPDSCPKTGKAHSVPLLQRTCTCSTMPRAAHLAAQYRIARAEAGQFHSATRGQTCILIFLRRRGGFWLSAAEQYWKIEMLKWFRVRVRLEPLRPKRVRSLGHPPAPQVIRDLELLPEFGGQNWSTVFLQKFEGSVTIWPKSRRTFVLETPCIVPDP